MAIVGMGVDVVDVERIERLTARNEDIFRARILGDSERRQIPVDLSSVKRHYLYACAIAAKEALLKALGTGLIAGMRWPDIQMVQTAPIPTLIVHGETQKILTARSVNGIHFSVSARGRNALATVVLTSEPTIEVKQQ